MEKEWRDLVISELVRVRQSIDNHSKEISDMRVDLASHKTKTSIVASFLGAAAGFLMHIFK